MKHIFKNISDEHIFSKIGISYEIMQQYQKDHDPGEKSRR